MLQSARGARASKRPRTPSQAASMEESWRSMRDVDERTRQLVATSSRVVLATHVEPVEDMRAERARSALDSRQLAEYLNGGKEKLQRMCACTCSPALVPAQFAKGCARPFFHS